MFSGFMLPTWVVASAVALVAGLVGTFVVLRSSAFAAHALPLSAFPGAAAASLLGINTVYGMAAFALLAVGGIARLGRRAGSDVATALTLVTLLAFGALCLSLVQGYSSEIYALLFGQVLGVGVGDVWLVALLAAVVLVATALLYRPLLLSSIAPELARAQGISTRWLDVAFLLLLALATVLTLPVAGALLVFSLMVGPAAAARLCTRRPLPALLLSCALALVVVWLAIALAYVTDWPVGFFVGTLGALAYAAAVARARSRGRSYG